MDNMDGYLKCGFTERDEELLLIICIAIVC